VHSSAVQPAAKGRGYAYLSGFDPAWAKLSPGAVLLKHSIAESIAEGLRAFDFLRKPEAFKYLWGAEDVVNSRLVIGQARSLTMEGQVQAQCH
jgi:CelD/BcsL family acetyltransferase involved in cellulose biosynthesis